MTKSIQPQQHAGHADVTVVLESSASSSLSENQKPSDISSDLDYGLFISPSSRLNVRNPTDYLSHKHPRLSPATDVTTANQKTDDNISV